MMTSVVTGAAGFVGRALVRRLLAEGDQVRAIVLKGDPSIAELRQLAPSDPNALQIHEGDVADSGSISRAFENADRVFHTAALIHAWAPRSQFERVNVVGTRNVGELALAHGIARLVAVSTSDVFGLPQGDAVLTERSPLRPWDEPYADTKIEGERWLWRLSRESGLSLSVIYPGWVYGPGDRAFFPGLAKAIKDGQMLFWHPGVRLPFVYVENLVDACMLASTLPQASGNGFLVYDTDAGPTLQEVCARIAEVVGAPAPTRQIPFGVALTAARAMESLWRLLRRRTPPPLLRVDVKAFGMQFHFSNEKARRELNWTPKISGDEGLRLALDDLRRRLS